MFLVTKMLLQAQFILSPVALTVKTAEPPGNPSF